jgi:hypothetical protein
VLAAALLIAGGGCMNQQGTAENNATAEQPLRDWENSEWFREWLDCHERETSTSESGDEIEQITTE